MFVRKKKNPSGVVSVQIIDKSSGKYKLVKTVGSSDQIDKINQLYEQAHFEKDKIMGLLPLNFETAKEDKLVDMFYKGVEALELKGPELLLGKIFDSIGFNGIKDPLFRYLVITRLVYPVSKLKTIDYLYKYKGIDVSVNSIYRYLDKLHNKQIDQIKEIAFNHVRSIMKEDFSVVFYDVTTLYFETEDADDLRKTGFSKDGKHQHPQIVLGLLTSRGGYPIAYEIFEGDKYEGHTLIPVIETFKRKYNLEKLIVVADAGLMSKNNVELLCKHGYEYILGARIKNETTALQQQILQLRLNNGQSSRLIKKGSHKLIISYSAQRAGKDAFNRNRGLARLEKSLEKGKLSKKHINNRGYNKYLKLEGNITITIDYQKFKKDAEWDGLKGYLTNTKLSNDQVIKQYGQLWQIEKTFRISKTDLRIRPIYHYARRRIESHICIAFAASLIYKELERQLKERKSKLSPGKVIDTLKTIYALTITTPYSKTKHTRLLVNTEEQKCILNLFEI